jgi:hypothetical protein
MQSLHASRDLSVSHAAQLRKVLSAPPVRTAMTGTQRTGQKDVQVPIRELGGQGSTNVLVNLVSDPSRDSTRKGGRDSGPAPVHCTSLARSGCKATARHPFSETS